MALAIVTANTSASPVSPVRPVSPGSPAILACPGNEADKQQTQHQQQHQQHRVGDNDNCPLLHGNDLGLSAVPNLHSSQHIALSSSQSVRTETGQRAIPCQATQFTLH